MLMEMALQTQSDGRVKIFEATTIGRETASEYRNAYIITLKKLGFEEEKGHKGNG
jgi:hypothetical protein